MSRFGTLRWIGLVLLLVPALAGAQSEEPRPLPDPEDVLAPMPPPPPGIETIEIVGEQENAANVQDEAQAITAFSAEDLDRANIVNVDTLALAVPGLHVGQSGQEAIVTLRGIGTENASITGEPGVAFHVDGINYGQPAAARVAFFDLETLDVKLGPQGLSGGKNSTSGTINVVTKKPTDEYEAQGDIQFGNYDWVRGRGAVNVPLGEFAATRVAVFYEDRDGYLDNRRLSDSHDPFDADDFGFRAHLKLNPAESLELLLTHNYFRQRGNGPQSDLVPVPRSGVPCVAPSGPSLIVENPFPNNNTGPTVMPPRSICNLQTIQELSQVCSRDPVTNRVRCTVIPERNRYIPATEDADPRSTYADFESGQTNRFWGWTGHADWDVPALPGLGETQLKVLGGFQGASTDFKYDADDTDLDFTQIFSERGAKQYSAELQWSGVLGDRLEWNTGGFYLRERGTRDLLRPESLPGETDEVYILQDTDNTSYSAWLSGSYALSDSVELSLGGRWIKDVKKAFLLRSVDTTQNGGLERFSGCTGLLDFLIGPNGQDVPAKPNPWCSDTFRGTALGAGIDWRPFSSDDHLLFARIDRGHKSGGFRAGGKGQYKPEKNWAYSAGSKSTFFDGRLQLNLDGFFYQYQDMQIVVLDELTLRTENTDARMYGWDLKALAEPIEGLRLEATLSNLHTETIEYYSLDPANQITAGGSFSDPIAAYNGQRLNIRNLAETYGADDPRGQPYAATPLCFSPPPAFQPNYLCGLTGDKDGLDDFSGNRLSRAPKWKYLLAAEYEIPLGRLGSLTPRVQYSWQDDTYFRAFNQDFDLQDDYHLTDAKLIWSSPEQRWQAEAFVTNIENEAPKQNLFIGARSNGAPPVVWWGAPRFYGLRVGFKY